MEKTTKYGLFIILVVILLAGLLILNNGTNKTGLLIQDNEINKVKIGYLPLTASLPLFVAVEQGYFDDENVQVELIRFESSNLIMDSIIKGNLDGSGSVAYSTLFTIEEKSPNQFKIIDSNGETLENFVSFIIVKNLSEISEIKDLKGKQIITGPGLAGRAITETFLNKIGLTLDEVELIQVKYSLVPSTFIGSGADAVFIWEPYATIILNKNVGEVLVEGPRPKYVLNPYPASADTLSFDFIENHPDLTERYIRAIDKAVDFIRKNPDETKKILVKYTSLSEDIASKTSLYNYWKNDEINIDEIQNLADLMVKIHLLEKRVNVEKMTYKIGV